MTADTPSHSEMRKAAEGAHPIKREMSHEERAGMVVAGYRWRTPIPPEIQGSEWAYSYASHWSTPAAHENAERLYAESDVLSLLDEISALRGALEKARASVNADAAAGWRVRTVAAIDAALKDRANG